MIPCDFRAEEYPRLPSEADLETQFGDNPDLLFATTFALRAGEYIRSHRASTRFMLKPDGTRVTDAELKVNDFFISAVLIRSSGTATVIGEEESHREFESKDVWVIDPIDGTREYTTPDLGKLPEETRHSSVGIAKFRRGLLVSSVILNPFRREMYVADRERGTTYLNGSVLDLGHTGLSSLEFSPDFPYNYTTFKGANIDSRAIRRIMNQKPNGQIGSTLYQACMVANGSSAFSVFPGRSIHDIAPSALVVEMAGGSVCDLTGGAINWDAPNGAVYAISQPIASKVVETLNENKQ